MPERASLCDRLAVRPTDDSPAAPSLSTATLLASLRQTGDARLREQLFARYLPILRRWAHGRLPAAARDAVDTDDLVQICLLRALDRVEPLQPLAHAPAPAVRLRVTGRSGGKRTLVSV